MAAATKIEIYRASEAPSLMEAGCISVVPGNDLQKEGMSKLMQAGLMEGDEIKVLVNIPGFSLTYVWFKKGYPLPLHSHDADCLYYIVAGSIELGNETLGPRDSFFIPANVPYAYQPGPEGVEVLEFRHATQFDFRNFAKNAAFYDKGAENIMANIDAWRTAKKPSAVPA
jgi:quercetin dioxygenase-like cupin family protein